MKILIKSNQKLNFFWFSANHCAHTTNNEHSDELQVINFIGTTHVRQKLWPKHNSSDTWCVFTNEEKLNWQNTFQAASATQATIQSNDYSKCDRELTLKARNNLSIFRNLCQTTRCVVLKNNRKSDATVLQHNSTFLFHFFQTFFRLLVISVNVCLIFL
jgi:hypothetical protein